MPRVVITHAVDELKHLGLVLVEKALIANPPLHRQRLIEDDGHAARPDFRAAREQP